MEHVPLKTAVDLCALLPTPFTASMCIGLPSLLIYQWKRLSTEILKF